ncbi:molybdate transport system ATP-binding protein [Neorhizobium galegae]|uniref:molybdenum ABC transporter ATP-binding protein n=1 Tax=Neorhizobium galegae TaxID=399 RepID=UPI001AE1F786|nr:molybdenum ABC transporter ATP-binding protein [Neorhizobium galegae]MBP2550483.1 molybdate transport system ATP-binding protein [Neorhizobium galegae]
MTLSVDIRHRQGTFSLDVSFSSARGVTALFGRSGSGKTSVLRIVGGLVAPDSGRVVLDGEVLVDTDARVAVPAHRRRFGYVFQEPRLFPHMSVRQNLAYGRWFAGAGARRDGMDRVLDMLGIGALLDRWPGNLSGGEKQRVAIGRALLSAPRMLLMDEPLSALDEARKAEILPYLERLRDELDLPILYVSHSVSEVARLADRVVVLAEGRVAASGSASEMLKGAFEATGREAGSVLSGRVLSIDAVSGLAVIGFAGVELVVPRGGLETGRPLRVHIPAREVLLATQRPEGISALNVLEGRILSIVPAGEGAADIELACGEERVQSRITTQSVARLNLMPGRSVHAIIKTVALDPH